MAGAFFDLGEQRSPVASLWMQALTESGDEPEVRRFLRRHLREVHEFVAGVRPSLPGGRRGAGRPGPDGPRPGSSSPSAC